MVKMYRKFYEVCGNITPQYIKPTSQYIPTVDAGQCMA
jgi:hypothetical protein